MGSTGDFKRRRLTERDAREIEFVDERGDLECVLLVDLPDTLARRLRLADVRFEQRELACDRRAARASVPW